jgi:mannitol-1-phosphate 5-dehydrogenase
MIRDDKIIIFGAGKIGRSFIGQLFSCGGFEVVFVDIDEFLVQELNRRREYEVVVKSNQEKVIKVSNVRGISMKDSEDVILETATATIAAVSVGIKGLEKFLPVFSKALKKRWSDEDRKPLDLIIAENMHNADEYIRDGLKKLLPPDFPLNSMVGLIETSIGKMVPIMQKKEKEEDPLRIFAEPYNTLILNKVAFKNPIPAINGIDPKENIKAWVERKLFIHNLGHATAAYTGYIKNPSIIYLHEALENPVVLKSTRAAMMQAADILLVKHPGVFTKQDLVEHIDDLLGRFSNKYLGDTIYRVGCDLMRKLGPEDRLSGAIKAAIKYNLPYDKILETLVYACNFRAVDENGKIFEDDLKIIQLFSGGISLVLSQVCGFDPINDKDLIIRSEELNYKLMTPNNQCN